MVKISDVILNPENPEWPKGFKLIVAVPVTSTIFAGAVVLNGLLFCAVLSYTIYVLKALH